MKTYKQDLEQLKGKQHKIDKNKNGKIDAHDFELLHKEEEDRVARADYRIGPSGRKSHKEIVFKDSDDKEDDKEVKNEEVELDEKLDPSMGAGEYVKDFKKSDAPQFKGKSKEKRRTMALAAYLQAKRDMKEETVEEQAPVAASLMKHRISVTVSDPNHTAVSKRKEKIQKTVIVTHSDNKEGARAVGEKFYKKKGYQVHDSHHAGMVNEETELEEAFINGREYASQGVMHPDHAKFHKVGNSMDFYAHGTGDKISGKVTKNDGKAVHIQADKSSGGKLHKFKVTPHLPKPVNEEVETDTSEKNEMAQTQLHFIQYAAEEILEYIEMGGEIEEWYQNKLSKVHSDMESLHSYMEGAARRTGMKEEVELVDFKKFISKQ